MDNPIQDRQHPADSTIWQRWIAIATGVMQNVAYTVYAKVVSIRGDITNDNPLPVSIVGTAITASATNSGALSADDSAALEASSVSKNSAGRLYLIAGVSNVTQYLQVHNAAALPADASVPLISIPVQAGVPFSFDFGVFGKYFSNGIVWCNSTTQATKTIGAANCFVNVLYL